MTRYYINKKTQANGDHEVHHEGCLYLPTLEHSEYLGRFNSCFGAVSEAKDRYPRTNGCKHCSTECNTS